MCRKKVGRSVTLATWRYTNYVMSTFAGEFRQKRKSMEDGCLTDLQVKNLINEINDLHRLLVSDIYWNFNTWHVVSDVC
jgi:hypothetical protein